MTLREARIKATQCWALLIQKAFALGYECAMDEGTERITEKDPMSDHMPGSLHHLGLALDLNLYKDGRYITNDEGHKELGEYWKSLHPDCRWGGDFARKDYNHYSFAPKEIAGGRG